MAFVSENLRLKELVAIVRANEPFYHEFVRFLQERGYSTVRQFIAEDSDEKALRVIREFVTGHSSGKKLYDGLLRPYSDGQANWYFLAWLLRDAPAQRLAPLMSGIEGRDLAEKRSNLLNQIRKYVAPLFPLDAHWEWPAIAEVMLARIEGSRRALKGTLFEAIVRRLLETLFAESGAPLKVSDKEIRLHDETYDVRVTGKGGSILLPVKTRETMGGGHAMLFTRDIHKSIAVAEENGFACIPIVIAESWGGDLAALNCENFIYIQANPNQIAQIEPLLAKELLTLLPVFLTIG